MKALLEVIGATVMTIVILGTPILSFVSFVYDWHGFLEMVFIIGLVVDFLYVFWKLLGETK